jgi:hypothetical protein
MQYQDDNFSKAYTTALYQTKGEVKTNIQVKNDENLEIDLLFVANPQNSAWEDEDLGLFDRLMRVPPTICVEHYSGCPQHLTLGLDASWTDDRSPLAALPMAEVRESYQAKADWPESPAPQQTR